MKYSNTVTSSGPLKLEVSVDFVNKAHEAACVVWKKKIEEEFPQIFPPKVLHKVGNRYKRDFDEYILAMVDRGRVNLIRLSDGLRWTDPFLVSDSASITKEEFNKLTENGEFGTFNLIEK